MPPFANAWSSVDNLYFSQRCMGSGTQLQLVLIARLNVSPSPWKSSETSTVPENML
jgi:hypothetical protein